MAAKLSDLAVFRNEHLSVSRLRLYEQCPRAFYFRYVNKGETAPRGEAAAFGTALHAALELIYQWIIREEYSGLFPMDQLVECYRQAWQESKLTDVAMYQEGLQILRMYARSRGPIDHFSILATEQEFNVDVDGFVMNGYIDRVDKVDDDALKIVDFKSNRKLYSRNELDSDLQMSVYGIAARHLYPWAKRVTFEFHMLRFDVIQKTERTSQQIDDARGYVVSLGRQTESDTTWEPRLNENCAYCDHRRRCDAYAKAVQGKADITKVVDPNDLTQIAKERAEVARLAKMMYARQRELDDILKAKLKEEGEYDVGSFHVRYINSFERSYPIARTIQIFERVGVPREEIERRILTVDKDAVSDLRISVTEKLERGPALLLKAELEAVEEKTPGTPRLDVQTIRGNKK